MINCIEEIYEEVVGRREEILMIVSALEAGKHIFLEGPPGTSKSTILKAIADHLGTEYCLITGNSDLTTSKLIGYFDPAETLSKGYKPEYFIPGPLLEAMQKGSYLYIEEFNRLPDETTNVFVTVMSEKKLTVPRLGIVESNPGFRIIAALNPLDDIGISRISRALKDRFSSIRMDYQSEEEEREIVRRRTNLDSSEVIALAVAIARATRRHPDVKLGSSVRGSIDMIDIYAKAMNGLGRAVTDRKLDDGLLLRSAIMSFRSKIWIYETSEKTPEDVIGEIFGNLQKKN
ncbi:MAG: MoxR family ATPase [Syntrophobacterales bacterium]|nr:MoxR family ATPase [Syntrophobacterales bacterium]